MRRAFFAFCTLILLPKIGTANSSSCFAGISPGELEVCGESICLFEFLTGNPSEEGLWTGPEGWVADECGAFNPETDPEGDYTYTVQGLNDDVCIATIQVVVGNQTDLGTLAVITECLDFPRNLFEEIIIPQELPTDGNWHYPNTYPDIEGVVPDGIIFPNESPEGIYTYAFNDGPDCIITGEASVIFSTAGTGGIETWINLPHSLDYFCPFEHLDGSPSPGGQWIHYGEYDQFLDFLAYYDECLPFDSISDRNHFTYVLGAPPCAPSFTDLHINILPENILTPDTAHTFCMGTGEIDLMNLMHPELESGGTWIDPEHEENSGSINTADALSGIYVYTISEGLNPGYALLQLEITYGPFAGPDTTISFCPDNSQQFLSAHLSPIAEAGGQFSNESIIAIESSAGDYLYIIGDEVCGFDTATYTVDFHNLPEVEIFTAQCNIEAPNTYAVSAVMSSGLAPFNSQAGSFVGNVFDSSPISVSENPNFMIEIEDANGCTTQISGSISDSDGDGICDEGEIAGCMNPESPNFNPLATDPGWCAAISHEVAVDTPSEFEPQGMGGLGLVNQTEEFIASWDFAVFPNPKIKDELLIVELKNLSSASNYTIRLSDMTGRLIFERAVTAQKGYNLIPIRNTSGIENGTYILNLIDDTGSAKSKVLLISN